MTEVVLMLDRGGPLDWRVLFLVVAGGLCLAWLVYQGERWYARVLRQEEEERAAEERHRKALDMFEPRGKGDGA